jgi:hypothetical protein
VDPLLLRLSLRELPLRVRERLLLGLAVHGPEAVAHLANLQAVQALERLTVGTLGLLIVQNVMGFTQLSKNGMLAWQILEA